MYSSNSAPCAVVYKYHARLHKLSTIPKGLPIRDARAHGGAAALPRTARERELDGGGGHAVLLAQRAHDAQVGEEELDNGEVLALYGELDGGAA